MHIFIDIRLFFIQIYKAGLKILAPPFCGYCHIFLRDDHVFCEACALKIKPVVSTSLAITKTKSMKVFAITGYQDPLKSLILAKGFANRAVSCQLGQLIWERTNVQHVPFDLLVPVPLHWTRFAWRGYNQAEEIAQVIAQKSDKPVELLVKRVVQTQQQSKLTYEMRQNNVKNVFKLSVGDAAWYKGKHILLVDDLMTTGATLQEVGKQLLKLQPASITAVVACRVM